MSRAESPDAGSPADRAFVVIDDGRVASMGWEQGMEVARRAEAAGRPVAIDGEEGVAYLGVSAAERAARLVSLEAPDFTLPDLAGRPHTLSEHRGRKVFLVAYASW